jgi:hypothetical protein
MFFSFKATAITYGGFRGLQRLQRLFIIALFGAIIFVGNLFLPPPLNYLMMVVQAVLLGLASLFIQESEQCMWAQSAAYYALASPSLGPFTFIFAFLYGVFVDAFMAVFRVKGTRQGANRNRLMAVMALSTLCIAVASYSAFAVFLMCLRRRDNLHWIVPSAESNAGYACAVYGACDGRHSWICDSVPLEQVPPPLSGLATWKAP